MHRRYEIVAFDQADYGEWAPAVVEFEREVWAPTLDHYPDDEVVYDKPEDAHYGLYAGTELMAVAGLCGSMFTRACLVDDDRFLYMLDVRAGSRGRGFGSALLTHVETKSRRQGYRTLTARGDETDFFYVARGYEPFQDEADNFGLGDWYLRKQLQSTDNVRRIAFGRDRRGKN